MVSVDKMPKQSLPPYECPRCGYQTPRKPCMRDHFLKKKPCPGVKEVLELTDEIKEHVLVHRVYKIPKDEAKVIINNYNQYNNVNNIVAGMDAIDKLQQYMDFKGQSLIDFETTTSQRFLHEVEMLDQDKRCDFFLDTDKLLEAVERASKPSKHLKDPLRSHNVIYDNKFKELKFYENGSWESMPLDRGTKEYILCIQRNYLDMYEKHLIRVINDTRDARARAQYREMLELYFKFIGCFDVEPYCKDADDDQILRPSSSSEEEESMDYDSEDEDEDSTGSESTYFTNFQSRHREPTTTLQETYYPMYKQAVKTLTKAFVNKMIRTVQDVIKRNSAKNVDMLNERIAKLIHMDSVFRNIMLDKPRRPFPN